MCSTLPKEMKDQQRKCFKLVKDANRGEVNYISRAGERGFWKYLKETANPATPTCQLLGPIVELMASAPKDLDFCSKVGKKGGDWRNECIDR